MAPLVSTTKALRLPKLSRALRLLRAQLASLRSNATAVVLVSDAGRVLCRTVRAAAVPSPCHCRAWPRLPWARDHLLLLVGVSTSGRRAALDLGVGCARRPARQLGSWFSSVRRRRPTVQSVRVSGSPEDRGAQRDQPRSGQVRSGGVGCRAM